MAAVDSKQPQQQQQIRAPGIKRLLVIASAVAYVVFLGIPVWWHTTSLHRPPLPHDAMQQVALAASSSTAFLPVTLQLVVLLPAGQENATGAQLAAGLYSSVQSAVAANKLPTAVHLSVTVTSTDGLCYQHPAADTAAAVCSTVWPAAAALLASSSSTLGQQQFDHWLLQQQRGKDGHSGAAAGGAPGHYTLYLLHQQQAAAGADSSSSSSSTGLVVGRHRHAWVAYNPAQAGQQQQLQELAAAAAVKALSCCFALHAGPQGLAVAGTLPISPSGRTHLSFSLLNADPADGPHFSWNMEEWEAQYLTPVISSLAPVARVTAESQVLQYTAARLQGRWSDKHGAYVVKGSQLPFFIDGEWSLESGRAVPPHDSSTHSSSNSSSTSAAAAGAAVGGAAAAAALVEPHVLQFVVYVPPKQHRPLQLLGRKGRIRNSNSYVIPSWGGLMVLNPDCTNSSSSSSSSDGGADSSSDRSSRRGADSGCQQGTCPGVPAAHLSQEQYQYIAAVVIAQLQTLFGVAPADANSSSSSSSSRTDEETIKVQQLPAGRLGFSGWQIDALMRQRSGHDVREAARVLAALSTLVQELPNLEMPDLIGHQVARSLSDISSAWQHTAAANYSAAAAAATAAHAAAEAAFSHPAVLAQLNFPESHKLGVYMPLFLPLFVPLIQGLMGQLVYYSKQRQRYQQLLQASRATS